MHLNINNHIKLKQSKINQMNTCVSTRIYLHLHVPDCVPVTHVLDNLFVEIITTLLSEPECLGWLERLTGNQIVAGCCLDRYHTFSYICKVVCFKITFNIS